jgi:hypothetical protein
MSSYNSTPPLGPWWPVIVSPLPFTETELSYFRPNNMNSCTLSTSEPHTTKVPSTWIFIHSHTVHTHLYYMYAWMDTSVYGFYDSLITDLQGLKDGRFNNTDNWELLIDCFCWLICTKKLKTVRSMSGKKTDVTCRPIRKFLCSEWQLCHRPWSLTCEPCSFGSGRNGFFCVRRGLNCSAGTKLPPKR